MGFEILDNDRSLLGAICFRGELALDDEARYRAGGVS